MNVIILALIAVAICKRTNALGSGMVDSESSVALHTPRGTVNGTVMCYLRRTVLADAFILCRQVESSAVGSNTVDTTYECTGFCRGSE